MPTNNLNTSKIIHNSDILQTDDSHTANYLLQLFLNNTDNSFILTDREFRIVFFNKLAHKWSLQYVGISLYVGMPIISLASEDRKVSQQNLMNEVLRGEHCEMEYEISLPEKDYVCFYNAMHPARNNDGDIVGILITSKDITETKKKTEALRISNERYELISKATSDATWDYDLINNDVTWQESFTKFFGHEYSENINGYDLWEKYIHPEDKERVISKLNEAIKNGDVHWNDEYRFLKDDGKVVHVFDRGMIIHNEAGDPVRMIGSMQDITQKKEAESKIALSEHRFRSLVQTGNDLIGILDEDGNYKYVSPTVVQLGYEAEFLLGKNAFDFIHPDDVPLCSELFNSLFTQRQMSTPPIRYRNAQGEWRWLETIATNLLDDPTIQGIVVNSTDVTERKEKDEALEKALNDLNKVLDSSVDVIVVTDENDRYVKVSAASETVWGYKPAELIGRSCTELVHPDDKMKTSLATANVMAGAKFTNFQNRYIRKDGSVVPLMWSAKWDAEQNVMYAIARDASEKEKAETALRLSEERYRDLFENNPMPMFMFDIEALQFVMVNEAALALYGYTRQEFLAKKVTDIRPEEELPRFLSYLDNMKDKHAMRYAGEWKHLKKDGTVFEIELRSHNVTRDRKLCRLSVINDLTERNEARTALQKSEAMFRAISENFPNGIVSILDRDMNFLYAAGKELDSLGITSEYFIGTHYKNHFTDEDDKIIVMAEKVFEGEPIVSEIKFFNRNYLLSSVPLHDADGSINRMLVVAQNITSQKEIQKEKELLIEELTKTINDLKQFSYITSHNLRAPICNLMGIMDLIEMDKIQDSTTLLLVEKFKESTFLLNDTVNDLLNVLLIKNNVNIQREVLNIDMIWKDVCTSVNNLITDANARITADFTEGNQVVFNKSYAESVLLNLLTNAIKYRSDERPLHIELSTKSTDEYLVLEFSDNGIGINLERHRHKIFGLYQRFHNYTDSKGLGLYIVHSQITALGGKIEVESTENSGTCFRIFFKMTKKDVEQSIANR